MILTEALEEIAGATQVEQRAISAPKVLTEAFDYPRPSSPVLFHARCAST